MSTLPAGTVRAAAVSRRISPGDQVPLGASDSGSLPWQGIVSDLEVNVLALWMESDEPAMLIVTLDLLYPGSKVREAVEAAAAPLPADRIVVAASHTHRAPMTDASKPVLGRPDPAYMSWVADEVRLGVEQALSAVPQPVTLAVGETIAEHSINRRLRKKLVVARRPRVNDVVNAPNPEGQTDEQLTAVVVKDSSDRPLAILWNYACHPVGGPVRNGVDSHFPGYVRRELRAALADDAMPILFLQGFSGDVRPNASAKVHSTRRRLRQLATGRLFEDMTWPTYEAWCGSLASLVVKAVGSAVPIRPIEVHGSRVTVEADRFVVGPGAADVSFGRLAIGDSLVLYTVSGEVVVAYAQRLRDRDTSRHVMCVGCADQVIGYLPTKDVLDEGGYEAGGYCASFGLDRVAEDVDGAMMASFEAVGLPVMRNQPPARITTGGASAETRNRKTEKVQETDRDLAAGVGHYSIFQQPWWLDATAPGRWDAVEIEEGGRVVARLPFVATKKLGLRVLSQPSLTQALGPWIERIPESSSKRLAREKDLYSRLIAGLPTHDVFRQNFHSEVTNWLPFYWSGFSQTTRYSYVLDGIQDQAQLLAGFSKTTRNLVKQAERILEVTESDDVEDVLDLAEMTFARQGKSLPYSRDLLRRIDASAHRHAHRRALIARDAGGRAHAAAYIVGDQAKAYLLVTGADPELRKNGAGNLVHWRAIQAAGEFTDAFDFEGSMLEPIEEFYRKFGATQSPYSFVSRSSRLGALAFEARRLMSR